MVSLDTYFNGHPEVISVVKKRKHVRAKRCNKLGYAVLVSLSLCCCFPCSVSFPFLPDAVSSASLLLLSVFVPPLPPFPVVLSSLPTFPLELFGFSSGVLLLLSLLSELLVLS